MVAYRNLWLELCSFRNLELAFKKARKGKTTKDYIIEFEQNLKENLLQLRMELLFHSYRPKPLQTFILHDPKTRKISKSHFRDRVIHHALCNIIEPLFEKHFIYDSYANRKTKGTLRAVRRFGHFKKIVSKNHTKSAFVLKADIRKYFENVDHSTLLSLLGKKIKDPKIMWLSKVILSNYSAAPGKGMPLGNLTSQFFANIYLNELDQYVKQELKAKHYLRYVDDFVIIHNSKEKLIEHKEEINLFLSKNLALQLHPDKSKIIPLERGIEFLGLRIFPYHKLIKDKNIQKFKRTFVFFSSEHTRTKINFDKIYDFIEGWNAYAKNADTFILRKKINSQFEKRFSGEISTKEINLNRKFTLQ